MLYIAPLTDINTMRNNIKSIGFLALTAIMLSACTTSEKVEVLDMEKVRGEIQAMEDAYAAGEKAKDADAVAAYYSDDAMGYSRNQQPLSGKSAIRDNIAKAIASDTTGNYSVYKVVDLFAEGNTAVEIGSWTKFDSSGTEMENGNYMSYFQKRDGKYLCVRDMSTTTSPAE
jgi:ketosteroid isomerase-like protein